jgi:hypothetical protein
MGMLLVENIVQPNNNQYRLQALKQLHNFISDMLITKIYSL